MSTGGYNLSKIRNTLWSFKFHDKRKLELHLPGVQLQSFKMWWSLFGHCDVTAGIVN